MTHTMVAANAASPARETQRVVVVNGSTEVLGLLESALDSNRYDIVFVEAGGHAYSTIRQVQPHLIILCMNIEDSIAFQLLSMLKIDEETRNIPVLTCASADEESREAEAREESESPSLESLPALSMN